MTRNYIIEKSAELFLLNGFKTVTMDEIASDLAMSKKTLYEEFGNKENLIEDTLNLQFSLLQKMAEEVRSEKMNPVEEIVTIRERISGKMNSPQHKNSFVQLKKYYPKLYGKVYLNQAHHIQHILTENIERGQQMDLYRNDFSADHFAELFMFTQASLKNSEMFIRDLEKMTNYCDLHFDIIIRGILTEKGFRIYNQQPQTL